MERYLLPLKYLKDGNHWPLMVRWNLDWSNKNRDTAETKEPFWAGEACWGRGQIGIHQGLYQGACGGNKNDKRSKVYLVT